MAAENEKKHDTKVHEMSTKQAAKKEQRKRVARSIFAVVFVSLLSIAATLAYLRYQTPEETHTFTLGQGVDIILTQDESDNGTFVPGVEYTNKKAFITIPQSAMETEYIAAKIHFYMEDEVVTAEGTPALKYKEISFQEFEDSYAKLCSCASIDGRGRRVHTATEAAVSVASEGAVRVNGFRKGWQVVDSTVTSEEGLQLYFVNEEGQLQIAKHAMDYVLFDTVLVPGSFSNVYGASFAGITVKLYDVDGTDLGREFTISQNQFKGFRIVVSAYAVQGNIAPKAGKEALAGMMERLG